MLKNILFSLVILSVGHAAHAKKICDQVESVEGVNHEFEPECNFDKSIVFWHPTIDVKGKKLPISDNVLSTISFCNIYGLEIVQSFQALKEDQVTADEDEVVTLDVITVVDKRDGKEVPVKKISVIKQAITSPNKAPYVNAIMCRKDFRIQQ